MKPIFAAFAAIIATATAFSISSCNDTKSYAELLNEENIGTNNFLADQRVIPYEERDSSFVFECGEDAPYYQLDEDGNLYMQVLNPGTRTEGNFASYDQLIYFRFTRYNLNSYANGELPAGEGNSTNLAGSSASFRYGNLSMESSYKWGQGVQTPLQYLPIDCEVNLVVKSQYGLYSEIAYVIPFLYKIRYFKSQI